jgi:hypothetical protein
VQQQQDLELSTTSLWERVTGWASWRKERQVRKASAEAKAQYVGIDSWGEEDIRVDPKVGFIEWCRQGIDQSVGAKLASRPRNSVHREHYRFQRNARIVKALTEEVYCTGKCRFTKEDKNDVRCLRLLVKQVLDGAVEDGIMVPVGPDGTEQRVHIKRCQRKFFTDAVEAAYFVQDEGDEFFKRLSTDGSATTR